MNKQHYIKPATTVFAVQPLDILAGSGTFELKTIQSHAVMMMMTCGKHPQAPLTTIQQTRTKN